MHVNAETCPSCDEKLKGTTHPGLLAFAKDFRKANPDGHISQGVRGKADQEADFVKGVSKAHFGQSAHNYGLGLDWFRLTQAGGASFDSVWYKDKLAPAAQVHGLVWGGNWQSIKDLPHVEVADWKDLAKRGQYKLVD